MRKTAKQMDESFDVPTFSFGSTAVVKPLPVNNDEPLDEANFNLEVLKNQIRTLKASKSPSSVVEKKPNKG